MTPGDYRMPEPLGDEVRRELARLGPSIGAPPLADLISAWPAAVGPAIAANAWPARQARDGTLVVHVASSAWAQELTQLEPVIRERLGGEAPPRMRFAVGPLPEPGHESVPGVEHSGRIPTEQERRRADTIALPIGDQALREAVSKAAALSLARSRDREA